MKLVLRLVFIILCLSAITGNAQECDQEGSEFNTSTINTAISPLGLWYDGDNGTFEYPAGGGVHALFAGGFWTTGLISDTARVATQRYQRRSEGPYEFREGPIGALDSLYFCDIFHITRSAVDQHLADLSDGQLDNPIPEIIKWPGRGNANGPAVLMQDEFAPFEDLNNNQIYEPAEGEYPSFVGNQAAWWVVNTRDAPGSFSLPWDTELHVFLQAFNEGVSDQLLKTQFLSATLINRGSVDIDSAALTFWVDPDVGCSRDDAIGSIPDLKLLYAYNYDTLDGFFNNTCSGETQPYPGTMPVPVTQILASETTLPGLETSHGAVYLLNTSIITPPAELQNPTVGIPNDFFNVTHGRWKNGVPVTRGGYGVRGTEKVDWPFDGNPADTSAWSACDINGTDYKYLLNTNLDAALPPNERLTVDYAVYVVDSVALPCPSTDLIREAANEILDFYDQGFPSSIKTSKFEAVTSFNTFPNPSTGTFQCVLPKGISIQTLEAFDATGRRVFIQWENQSNSLSAQIESTGIFFLVASDTQGNQYRSRVIIE